MRREVHFPGWGLLRDKIILRTFVATLYTFFNILHQGLHNCALDDLCVKPKSDLAAAPRTNALNNTLLLLLLWYWVVGTRCNLVCLFVFSVWASFRSAWLQFCAAGRRVRRRRQPTEVSPLSLGVISPLCFVSRPLPQKQQSVNLRRLAVRANSFPGSDVRSSFCLIISETVERTTGSDE